MSWNRALIAAVVIGMIETLPGSAAADIVGDLRDAVATALREQQARTQPPPEPQRPPVPEPAPAASGAGGAPPPAPLSAEERRIRDEKRARRAAERARNMAAQSALKAFGFDVGAVDGDLGRRSQAAIAEFQTYLGYPATGVLDDEQRRLLLDSQRRLRAGEEARYPGVVAAEGERGLLKAFNDPDYAEVSEPPVTTRSVPDVPPPPAPEDRSASVETAPPPVMPDPVPTVETSAPGGVAEEDAPGGPLDLPELLPTEGRAVSMDDRCEIVELTTATNQGPIQAATMSDPSQALSEQFCAARNYAIAAGENTAASNQASTAQLLAACDRISAAMAPVRAGLARETPEVVAAQASAASGRLNAASAAIYGRICLGLGYRRDDPEMALSAGLLLVGAGHMAYAEVIGHHLREGFGVAAAPGAAAPWYIAAIAALEDNATPAFLPSKTRERVGVIRAALGAQVRASGPAPVAGLVPAGQPLPNVEVIAK
jgi:hypothetical protein